MFCGWDNFYLFIGSAAAAFIGMLFIVATLTAGRERSSALRGAKVYTTPTVFHFAVVMVVSATIPAERASQPHSPAEFSIGDVTVSG